MISKLFTTVLEFCGINKIWLFILAACVILCAGTALTAKHYYDKADKLNVTIGELNMKIQAADAQVENLKKQLEKEKAGNKIDDEAVIAVLTGKTNTNKITAAAKEELAKREAEARRLAQKQPSVAPKSTVASNSATGLKDLNTKIGNEMKKVSTEISADDARISDIRIDAVWKFYCQQINYDDPSCSGFKVKPKPDETSTTPLLSTELAVLDKTVVPDKPITFSASDINHEE